MESTVCELSFLHIYSLFDYPCRSTLQIMKTWTVNEIVHCANERCNCSCMVNFIIYVKLDELV